MTRIYRRPHLTILIFCILSSLVTNAQHNPSYKEEIDSWHAKRIAGLKADDGWLNLVGLYWLDEGANSFGSAKDNKLVFSGIARKAGYFERTGDRVTMVAGDEAHIKINGKEAKNAVLYVKDSLRSPLSASGSLRWTIIQRDDKIGVRLRDLKSRQLSEFKGIERYPVDSAWRISAILMAEQRPQAIAITNVLGQTNQLKSPGKLSFVIGGTTYTLDTLEEDGELFIIFGDSTSGKTTYPSGRFLKVAMPATGTNTTVIDFNKAYNPPCAFTAYATCPIPPKQNILAVSITAGEKDYVHH